MKLISPKFLQTCQAKKSRILKELFDEEDIFSVVMAQKKMSFEEACEWIADTVFNSVVPVASDSEIQMMQLAAKEMMKELKDSK